ncbi:hypothetical protein LIER_23620 [Lithospermum erythrorhizon]|uniref:HAT C-terminal dimerisation domain-containing protein n=1 Tax=Lithospermum erythrorhizon TaxID=34254 RepID=A0AAV3QY58_LITER
MVITRHFIDKNWTLEKRVLSFVNVLPPHNGPALAKEIHRVCNIYDINDKVCSVTVDNATANDVCIAILKKDHTLHSNLVLDGKLFHVRCCAHIINLLVRDGLKEIEHIVEVVRERVKYIFGLENRLRSFNEYRVNLKLHSNKLVLDNNTRWNSTYVMLQTAYTYRDCFTKYGQDDEAFERYVPNTVEWSLVHEKRIDDVMLAFKHVFDQYGIIYGDPKGKGPDSYNSYLKKPPSSTIGKRKFDDFMMKLQTQGKKNNDLELYFDEACYPNLTNFDALAWLRGNEGKYNVLSRMTNDILSIPITSVASESTFPAGGRIIDKKSLDEKGHH